MILAGKEYSLLVNPTRNYIINPVNADSHSADKGF